MSKPTFILALDAGHYLATPGKRCLKSLDPGETREWILNDRVTQYQQERARMYEGLIAVRMDDHTGRTETTLAERVALANAIDAKDKYTSGHSKRVADLSKKIAKEAGLSEEECDHVYFAALLHDVGKIGVRDDVINKPGKLTDEEFENIKLHPVLGNQILSSIRQSPYLSEGAHYHHERYDGKGYPEGLKGDAIPVIARIIAVADAYDAMTSTRSYRGALSKEDVRNEILNGMGKQFDIKFAAILLEMIDKDTVDQ